MTEFHEATYLPEGTEVFQTSTGCIWTVEGGWFTLLDGDERVLERGVHGELLDQNG